MAFFNLAPSSQPIRVGYFSFPFVLGAGGLGGWVAGRSVGGWRVISPPSFTLPFMRLIPQNPIYQPLAPAPSITLSCLQKPVMEANDIEALALQYPPGTRIHQEYQHFLLMKSHFDKTRVFFAFIQSQTLCSACFPADPSRGSGGGPRPWLACRSTQLTSPPAYARTIRCGRKPCPSF